jgi:hypothetical protein
MVASSNVTFDVTPEKIGEHSGGTLYILNCSDANGWWITGYTAQSLAEDLYKMLSPYFANAIVVQNTAQLGQVLDGTPLQGESLQNAVIVNTCGEAAPMPTSYNSTGYNAQDNSYSKYFYILGQKTRQFNWTWGSIVGYPMYYVSNTGLFPNDQNSWGIYGMKNVGPSGFNAFLRGLNQMNYAYDPQWITSDLPSVPLSSSALYYSNYYGLYPATYQTATRALPTSITSTYSLTVTSSLFDPVSGYLAGAVFRNSVSGGFLALGLTRIPDIRLTALALLSEFRPRLFRSDYTSYGTSRIAVLQLGLVGGA